MAAALRRKKPIPRLVKTYDLGFSITQELLEDDMRSNIPLHLRPLDEGDRTFMDMMRMDEQQYRVFLWEAEQEERERTRNRVNNEALGRHFDGLIMDDLELRQAQVDGPNSRGQAFYPGQLIPMPREQEVKPTAPAPLPLSPIETRRNELTRALSIAQDSYKEMMEVRAEIRGSSTTYQAYHRLLETLHTKTLAYLANVEFYLEVASIAGSPMLGAAQSGGQ